MLLSVLFLPRIPLCLSEAPPSVMEKKLIRANLLEGHRLCLQVSLDTGNAQREHSLKE